MERRVDLSNLDLDRAAELIAARRSGWLARGLTASALTWMDNDVPWPAPVLTDRSEARRPMSLGVVVHGEEDAFGEFVLYAGGWADVCYVQPGSDEAVTEYVEFDDADQVGPVLDRIASKVGRG